MLLFDECYRCYEGGNDFAGIHGTFLGWVAVSRIKRNVCDGLRITFIERLTMAQEPADYVLVAQRLLCIRHGADMNTAKRRATREGNWSCVGEISSCQQVAHEAVSTSRRGRWERGYLVIAQNHGNRLYNHAYVIGSCRWHFSTDVTWHWLAREAREPLIFFLSFYMGDDAFSM